MDWGEILVTALISVATSSGTTAIGFILKARLDKEKHEHKSFFDERITAIREHEAALAEILRHLETCFRHEPIDPKRFDPDGSAELTRAVEDFQLASGHYRELVDRTAAIFPGEVAGVLKQFCDALLKIGECTRWSEYEECYSMGQCDDEAFEPLLLLKEDIEAAFRRLRGGERQKPAARTPAPKENAA